MTMWNLLTKKEMKGVVCHLGDDIRRSRVERCYSQDYMANQLGITQSAYYKIEAGAVKITIKRLEQIADILGKPISVFVEKEIFTEELKSKQKIYTSPTELELLQKTISHQEKKIEELIEKIQRRDKKIEDLKLQYNV